MNEPENKNALAIDPALITEYESAYESAKAQSTTLALDTLAQSNGNRETISRIERLERVAADIGHAYMGKVRAAQHTA